MKYQNFIMRVLCLILILGAVIGYNSMEKKETESSGSFGCRGAESVDFQSLQTGGVCSEIFI